MKAVILAAGKSTRTYPLTLTKPKALLDISGKFLLARIMDNLIGLVDEIILIVEYKKEMIKEAFGDSYEGIPVTYVEQGEPMGTGHALLQAKDHLKDKFLVMNGDDLFAKEDIKRVMKHDFCMLLKEVENPGIFGVAKTQGSKVTFLVEKPQEFVSSLANVGVYVFDKSIFEHELVKSKRGEYELTDYIKYLIPKGVMEFETLQEYWVPIASVEDVEKANAFWKERFGK